MKSGMSALSPASWNARNTSAHVNNTIPLILVAEPALQRSLSQHVISHSPLKCLLFFCILGYFPCRRSLWLNKTWHRLLFRHIQHNLSSTDRGQKDRSLLCQCTCPRTLHCCIRCISDLSLRKTEQKHHAPNL